MAEPLRVLRRSHGPTMGVVGVLAATCVLSARVMAGSTPASMPDMGPAYPLNLTDVVTNRPLAPEIRAKTVLLSFIAGTCGESCPVVEAKFAAVQHLLRRDGYLGPRVQLVLLTIDPVTDTPPKLRLLARKIGAVPGDFHLASGSVARVRRILDAYGIAVRFQHGTRADPDHVVAVYLLDPEMRIRSYFGLEDSPALIARTAEQLTAAKPL